MGRTNPIHTMLRTGTDAYSGVLDKRGIRAADDTRSEHFPAHRGRGGIGRELVGGEAGGNEDDAIEGQLFQGITSQNQVAVVHGIESAAVKRETHL